MHLHMSVHKDLQTARIHIHIPVNLARHFSRVHLPPSPLPPPTPPPAPILLNVDSIPPPDIFPPPLPSPAAEACAEEEEEGVCEWGVRCGGSGSLDMGTEISRKGSKE